MKTFNRLLILSAVLIILGFVSAIYLDTILPEPEIDKSIVDCYDYYGNKIVGEICEEETIMLLSVSDLSGTQFSLIIISFLFAISGAIIGGVTLCITDWSKYE